MHKRFAPVLFVSLLAVVLAGVFTACSSVRPSVQNHTVTLDLRERLGVQGTLKLHKAAAYHDRYYCLYSYNSSFVGSGYMMEVVDKNSLAIEEILPPESKGYHYCDDLFVRHDTLFYHVYGSWCNHDFFLDTLSRKWVPCAKSDHLIAEDDDYRVYAVDHGEWGQATWFVNRATGLEYVVWGTGDVRRVGDTYYFVNALSVCSVSLPRLAAARPSPVGYRQAKDSYDAIKECAEVAIEPDLVYLNPQYDGFGYFTARFDTLIVGSLVDQRGLLLLVNCSDASPLRQDLARSIRVSPSRHFQVRGTGRLMRVADSTHLLSDDTMSFAIQVSDRRSLELSRAGVQANRLVLPFQSDALNSGLVDICNGQVTIVHIRHLVDTLPVLESDGLDTLITLLVSAWDDFDDSRILAFERDDGATFIREDSLRNGYFEDIGLTDSLCYALWFEKRVDTLYNLDVEYCLYKESRHLAALFFDFTLPQPYLSEDLWNKMSYDERQQWSARRSEELVARLDTRWGPHTCHDSEIVWHSGHRTLVYYPSSNRLLVY